MVDFLFRNEHDNVFFILIQHEFHCFVRQGCDAVALNDQRSCCLRDQSCFLFLHHHGFIHGFSQIITSSVIDLLFRIDHIAAAILTETLQWIAFVRFHLHILRYCISRRTVRIQFRIQFDIQIFKKLIQLFLIIIIQRFHLFYIPGGCQKIHHRMTGIQPQSDRITDQDHFVGRPFF